MKKKEFVKKINNILIGKRRLIVILVFSILLNIFLFYKYKSINNKFNKLEFNINTEKLKIFVRRNYFNENIKLKNYKNVRYKIKDEGKKIIENIRNVHKSPVLISQNFQDKELCAGYISELSKKIWGKKVIYSIGMQNTKTRTLANAWQLPYFYEQYGGKVLVDLSNKFSLKKKDYFEKISVSDLKEFFAKAFSEEALFGDIGFLYRKTKYTDFLKKWSYNSHITKNMGVSDFEIIISEIDKDDSNLDILMKNLGCDSRFLKYWELINNYKIFLNGKQIVYYGKDMNPNYYYLNSDNSLGKVAEFKYLDRITYKDIAIAHFFEGKARVDSLLKFTCNLNFYPINVISINGRMIEKM